MHAYVFAWEEIYLGLARGCMYFITKHNLDSKFWRLSKILYFSAQRRSLQRFSDSKNVVRPVPSVVFSVYFFHVFFHVFLGR